MAEQATPSVPESITAMKSPQDPDKVVVYDQEAYENDRNEWVEGQAVDPTEFP